MSKGDIMYKLFISDVDDTLLDHNKQFSQNFDVFLKTLQDHNILFTIATGRSGQAIQPIIDQLQLKLPYATSNGAAIMQEGKVIESFMIKIGPLKAVINQAQEMGITVIYAINGQEYALSESPFIRQARKQNFTQQIIRPFTEKDWKTLKVDKILLVDDDPTTGLERLLSLSQQLDTVYDYLTFSDWAMDIIGSNVNKGRALAWIADYLNISIDETIAAGDNHNDIALLRAAGKGIAVQNALNEAKEAADIIAKQKYGEGVIEEVHNLIKQEKRTTIF